MSHAAAGLAQVETQWLFTRDDLAQTPSVMGEAAPSKGGAAPTMTSAQERVLRAKGVRLICKMCEFLQVGQHVVTTAATYFHRFYMRRPLQQARNGPGWSHYEIAAACVFLACKMEESLRKLPVVVDATMASLDKSPEGQMRWADRSFRSNHASHEYTKWRDCILLHEEVLLTTLCFDMVVPQPHEVLVRATRSLEVETEVARLAWTVLNDCLRDPTCILYDAPVLAAGAFKKACLARRVDPAMHYAARPRDATPVPPEEDYLDWLDVFDVDEAEAQDALEAIDRDVYEFHLPLQAPRAAKPRDAGETKELAPHSVSVTEPDDSVVEPAAPAAAAAPAATASADGPTVEAVDEPLRKPSTPVSRESGELSS